MATNRSRRLRKKLCVDDLKNPYDHCPDAGAK